MAEKSITKCEATAQHGTTLPVEMINLVTDEIKCSMTLTRNELVKCSTFPEQ